MAGAGVQRKAQQLGCPRARAAGPGIERQAPRAVHRRLAQHLPGTRIDEQQASELLAGSPRAVPSWTAIPPSWPIQSLSPSGCSLARGGRREWVLQDRLVALGGQAGDAQFAVGLSSLFGAARPGRADVGEDVRAGRSCPSSRASVRGGGPVAADPAAAADFLAVQIHPGQPRAAFGDRAAEVDHRLARRRLVRREQTATACGGV